MKSALHADLNLVFRMTIRDSPMPNGVKGGYGRVCHGVALDDLSPYIGIPLPNFKNCRPLTCQEINDRPNSGNQCATHMGLLAKIRCEAGRIA